VASFKAITQAAQSRGVRAMAAYAPYGPTGSNGEIGGFLAPPDKDPVLLMLEELGMPILHTDVAQSGNWEAAVLDDYSAGTMSASNLMSSGTLTGTPVHYPVDFWLYDVRVALDFTSAAFATAWPQVAVVAQQYAYWPSGSHIHSYQHATEILTLVGTALASAQRLEPATACTSVAAAIDSQAYRTTGLGPAEYACYNPKSYGWCAASPDLHSTRATPATTASSSDSGGVEAGVVAGIGVGCLVVGVVVGVVAMKMLGGGAKPAA